MKYIIACLPMLIGFILDCILGDPYTMPHPIRLIGTLISRTEQAIRRIFRRHLRCGGFVLVCIVTLLSATVPLLLLSAAYSWNLYAGIAAESILCYYMLAARCLRDESMKVYDAEKEQDTERARKAVSMIVGRDTSVLDDNGIIRAAVETVAENTSDGVTAPILYMSLGGAVGGVFYKSVNTMDSMIGYTNETYRDIGFFAAKLDDVLNYIPSRLTALCMILAAFLLGMDGKNAFRIWRRDRRKHASPNSAQTESVCAGALQVRLAGDAWYFGELHKKEYIGDAMREIAYEDIRKANRLMYVTALLMLAVSLGCRILVTGVIQ